MSDRSQRVNIRVRREFFEYKDLPTTIARWDLMWLQFVSQ